jgi:predicted lipoprotein with Yx(FWY)xxD motif
MMSRTAAAVAATVVVCLGSLAFAQMAPAKIADTTKGKALVDAKGMTLYTFDKDAAGIHVQWPLRGELAAADGQCRRQAHGRLDGCHARRRQDDVGL